MEILGRPESGRIKEIGDSQHLLIIEQPMRSQYNPLIQSDMDPTMGSIAALVRGAKHKSRDVNAILTDPIREALAGQVAMEDDNVMRGQMDIGEYYPILQVKEIIWANTFGQDPSMTFVVTDGVEEMVMLPSHRVVGMTTAFWRKSGPYENGTLRPNKIFKLLDYYTTMVEGKSGEIKPCIWVERVKPQPKRNCEKFRTIWAKAHHKIFV
jgi:hypothetical protein